jgi:hypothetical protein
MDARQADLTIRAVTRPKAQYAETESFALNQVSAFHSPDLADPVSNLA